MKPTPLTRKTGLKRRTPLAKRSKKMRQIYVKRRELVSTELALRDACEARLEGCQGFSSSLHEPLTRARGGSILDKENTVAVCGHCAGAVHTDTSPKQEAMHERGLLRHSWDAKPDPIAELGDTHAHHARTQTHACLVVGIRPTRRHMVRPAGRRTTATSTTTPQPPRNQNRRRSH